MEKILTQFANSGASEKAGLFDSLGIDWALLAFQTVAFFNLAIRSSQVCLSANDGNARQARKRLESS